MRTYWKRRYRGKRKESGGLGHTETSSGCCQFFTNVNIGGLADRVGWCEGGGGAESGDGLLGVERVGVDAENHEN